MRPFQTVFLALNVLIILPTVGCVSAENEEDADEELFVILDEDDKPEMNMETPSPKRAPGQPCDDDPSACEDLCIESESGASRCQTRCTANGLGECSEGFACMEPLTSDLPNDSLYCQPEDEVACALQGLGGEGDSCMCGCEANLVCEQDTCVTNEPDPEPEPGDPPTFSNPSPSNGRTKLLDSSPLEFKWAFNRPNTRFDVYLSADRARVDELSEEARVAENTPLTRALVSTDSIESGTQHWRIVARVKGQTYTSPIYDFVAKRRAYQGPCSGEERIRIAGRLYDTAQIDDMCWMAADLVSGAVTKDGVFLDDDILQYSKFGPYYTWWEINSYSSITGSDGNTWANTDVSICPAGWGVPSLNDWGRLVSAHASRPEDLYSFGISLSIKKGGAGSSLGGGLESCDTGAGMSTQCTRDNTEFNTEVLYWTRTHANSMDVYAAAFDFQNLSRPLSRRESNDSWALRVRCIRMDSSVP